MSSKLFFGLFVEIALALLFSGVLSEDASSEVGHCDCKLTIGANESIYIGSSHSGGGGDLPSRSSCNYTIVAPMDYEINIQCNINLGKIDSAGRCTSEFLVVSVDGDRDLHGSEIFCGDKNVQRKSLFNRLVMAYSSSKSSSISCNVTAIPQPCDCGWSVTSKITGGVEANINEYPFVVGLFHLKKGSIYCGGVIISHRHILSAGHCFDGIYGDPFQIIAIVGEHNYKTESESPYTRRHQIDRIKRHEDYKNVNDTNGIYSVNDIAILYTATDIEWSRGVGPICLPFLYTNETFDGWKADVSGWGRTSATDPRSRSIVLMKTTVDIISNSECQGHHPYLTSSQICNYTPLKDSCPGDSGGPLIVRLQRMFTAGVISHGDICGNNSHGISVRVTSYLNWIQENTGANFCQLTGAAADVPSDPTYEIDIR